MSESVILWIFGSMVTVNTLVLASLAKAIASHNSECKTFRVNLIEMITRSATEHATKIEAIEREIGDHNSGLRGWLHKLSSDISPYIIRRQSGRIE